MRPQPDSMYSAHGSPHPDASAAESPEGTARRQTAAIAPRPGCVACDGTGVVAGDERFHATRCTCAPSSDRVHAACGTDHLALEPCPADLDGVPEPDAVGCVDAALEVVWSTLPALSPGDRAALATTLTRAAERLATGRA